MMRRVILTTVFALIMAVGADAAAGDAYQPPKNVPPYGIGFRGDGTGVFGNLKVPTDFDETSSRNIRWKAPLPNWGYGSPVPVGNRVLFVSEPGWKAIWPELCCFDADSGALIWKVPVDPCDAFPDLKGDKRKEVTEAVASIYEQSRIAYRICAPLEKTGYADSSNAVVVAANAELSKHGMTVGGYKQGYGLLRQLRYTDDRKKKWEATIKPYGMKPECTWQGFGRARCGIAFSTPVTDGRRIWVMTYHGTVACFDMDGKRIWSVSSRYKGHHGLLASPRLCDDLLITAWMDTGAFDARIMAWDKTTGAKKWEAAVPAVKVGKERSGRPGGSPVILDLGGAKVVLCSSGHVVRVKDGFVYESKIGPTTIETWAVDDEKDAIFFQTGGDNNPGMRIGLDLSLSGNQLTVKERYGLKGWNSFASPVFFQGRLFHPRVQLDPANGHIVQVPEAQQATADARKAPQTSPNSNHLLLIAGGHVYGLDEKREKGKAKGDPDQVSGVCEVFALDGKKVSTNVLRPTPRQGPASPEVTARQGEKAEQWNLQGWGGASFSYCCAMNIGPDPAGNGLGRLYICSDDYLYCVGNR